MLSKTRKIKREDFPQDFHKGYKYYAENLFLIIIKQKQQNNPTQVSFIVSKKVSKSAVKRILLKRKGYSSIKRNIQYLKSGFLCIFHFKKGAEELSFSEIEKEIIFLLQKSKVLNPVNIKSNNKL